MSTGWKTRDIQTVFLTNKLSEEEKEDLDDHESVYC